MSSVLIAGCGYVGLPLGLLLAGLGHDVRGLRRDPRGLPAPLEPVAADLTDPASLAGLEPADWVVFAASPGGHADDAYRSVYVEGLANLLAALGPRGPERLVFVSSTGVYGQEDGAWVDEDSPTEPTGFAGRRLLEAEARVAALGPAGVCLRLGGIYGPGRTRLIENVLNGESDYAAGPPRWTNRIHRDDAVLAIAHLLELDDPEAVYCGVDREPASEEQVLKWLAERLDVPAPRAVDHAPPARRGNKRVSSERLVASGFRFRFPTFREGYGALIEGLGESLWTRGEGGR